MYEDFLFMLKKAIIHYAKRFNITYNGPKFFTTDFEKAVMNAVNLVFPDTIIIACYFHLVQNLWDFSAKNKLRTKKQIMNTKLIINLMKFIIHLPREEKLLDFGNEILNDLTE